MWTGVCQEIQQAALSQQKGATLNPHSSTVPSLRSRAVWRRQTQQQKKQKPYVSQCSSSTVSSGCCVRVLPMRKATNEGHSTSLRHCHFISHSANPQFSALNAKYSVANLFVEFSKLSNKVIMSQNLGSTLTLYFSVLPAPVFNEGD